MRKIGLSAGCFFLCAFIYAADGRITISERSDYSLYINGKYAGMTYRETYMYLDETQCITGGSPVYEYNGEAFVLEETRKNMIGTAKKLDAIRPIAFTHSVKPNDGTARRITLQFTKDEGYPLLRNFPISPENTLQEKDIGKQWTANSEIVVCPIAGGQATRIPIIAEYQYLGEKKYNGQSTRYVRAKFALRYRGGDTLGDAEMTRSEGTRDVDIYLDENNRPLFIREKIDESFFYKNTDTIREKGFLLHFYNYGRGTAYSGGSVPSEALYTAQSKNDRKTAEAEQKAAETAAANRMRIKKQGGSAFEVQETARGLLLNLKNLNFVANKAELLDGEDKKLDETAAALQELTFKTLFVEGHTVDIGNPEEQQTLSLQRAKTVVDELTKRGIPASKFIYSGAGGTKPIVSNADETQRALNRRVEITIME